MHHCAGQQKVDHRDSTSCKVEGSDIERNNHFFLANSPCLIILMLHLEALIFLHSSVVALLLHVSPYLWTIKFYLIKRNRQIGEANEEQSG